MVFFNRSYSVSYYSVVTMFLTCTISKIRPLVCKAYVTPNDHEKCLHLNTAVEAVAQQLL